MKTDYKKEFLNCLNSIDRSKRRYDIFKDFLTATTLAFQNSTRFIKDQKIEDDYKELIENRYTPEQIKKLAELLYITTMALTEKTQDFLGDIYMFGEFGNKHTGQFFTPYHIADFMSQITIYETYIEQHLKDKGYMTICDPCCGSGVFMIAASNVVMNMGYNPQQVLHIDGTDIDNVCCQMAYIQTALLGLSGTIHYGNSITKEMWDYYKTPMTDINYWRFLGTKPKKNGFTEIKIEKPIKQENERINENEKQEEAQQLTIKFM